MNPKKILLLALLFSIAITAVAAQKLNIGGGWKLDQNRSFSNPPGFDQTMTIAHNGDEVKIEAKITAQGRETQITETWTLDGKEYEFTPPGAQANSKGKRKATWLPGGKGILVEDVSTIRTPNGEVNQRTTRKYTMSVDGSSLIVDYFIDRGEQSFETKRVFVKN